MPGWENHTLWLEQHSASSSAPANQAATRLQHPTHLWPVAPAWALGKTANSLKRNGALHLKGICYYCASHYFACPQLSQLLTSQTCCGGSCYLHHTGEPEWPWGVVEGPQLSQKTNTHPSPQVCNLDHVVTQHTLWLYMKHLTPFRLGPNQCCSHLALRGFFSYLSLSPWFLLTLYQHSLIWVLPQISWTHLWAALPPFVLQPWTSQLHCGLLDGKPALLGSSMSLWIYLFICWPLNPVPLSPCDETAPIITHHFQLGIMFNFWLCASHLFKHWHPIHLWISIFQPNDHHWTAYIHTAIDYHVQPWCPQVCFWRSLILINGRSHQPSCILKLQQSILITLVYSPQAVPHHGTSYWSWAYSYSTHCGFQAYYGLHSMIFPLLPIIPTDPLFPPHHDPKDHITWKRTSQKSGREWHFISGRRMGWWLLLDHMPVWISQEWVLTSSQLRSCDRS